MKVIFLHAALQCILSATFVYAKVQRRMITRIDMISGIVDEYVSEMTTAGMNVVENLDEVEDKCTPNEFHPGTLVEHVENVEYYEDCAVICRSMVDTCFVITYAKLTRTCLMARDMASRWETFKDVTTEYCEIEKITDVPEPSDDGIEEPAHGQAYAGCGQPTWPFELTPATPDARRKRILGGGRPTNHYSLPWMVDLENAYGGHNCGGTLINDGRYSGSTAHLLTAAHCVMVPNNVTNVVVLPPVGRLIIYARAGSVDRRFTEAHEQRLFVKRAIIHGGLQWYQGDLQYDVAVLEVAGLYKFNDYVRPICLPEPNMPLSINQICYVAGWGREEAKVGSKYLKAAVVSVNGFLNDFTGRTPVVIKTTRHCGSQCAGNARQGDSGSPVFLFDPVRRAYVLVGVHSQSTLFPIEYTYDVEQIENEAMDVRYYRDWIMKAIESEPDWLAIFAHNFYL